MYKKKIIAVSTHEKLKQHNFLINLIEKHLESKTAFKIDPFRTNCSNYS